MKQVHWYPGHIHKTRKELDLKIKQVDTIVVIVDARAPFSSFIDSFSTYGQNKNVLVIISKIDFVNPKQLKEAVAFFKSKNYQVLTLNLKQKNYKDLEKLKKSLDSFKYKKPLPKVMIAGVPNVGKSSLINMLLQKNKAKVENRAGVTKQINWFSFDRYHVLDTPGILEPSYLDQNVAYKLALIGSIKLNILPLDDLVDYLQEVFEFNGSSELESFLNRSTKQDQEEKYLELIRAFQKGSFKINYLDNFSKDFEQEILI